MEVTRLDRLKGDMMMCFRCSLCKMVPLPTAVKSEYTDNCPVNHFYHYHAYSGGGQSVMALSLLDGRIMADDASLAKVVFSCTSCGYCDVACKFVMDAERSFINNALRERLVDAGNVPETHIKAMENLKTKGNISGDVQRTAGAWAEGLGLKVLPAAKAKTLLYAGCAQRIDSGYAQTLRKLAMLLQSANVDFGILGDAEPCCGLPAQQRGFRDVFTKQSAEVTALLDRCGVETIVVACGSCHGAFRTKYDLYGSKPKAKVLHATELLSQLIDKRKLKLNKAVNTTVTYHDPCYLGRQNEPREPWNGEEKTTLGQMNYTDPPKTVYRGINGVFDPPRAILKAIKGLTFNEMWRTREYAFCCGAGGGAPDTNPEMSNTTALYRLEEARDTGAQNLVTACPHCEKHLTKNARQGDESIKKIQVLDIIDLVYDAADLKR